MIHKIRGKIYISNLDVFLVHKFFKMPANKFLQFSDRLRQRFAKFHRVLGRFYVVGVFIGAPLGSYIQLLPGAPGWHAFL